MGKLRTVSSNMFATALGNDPDSWFWDTSSTLRQRKAGTQASVRAFTRHACMLHTSTVIIRRSQEWCQ
jgi:hypothetical protein